MSGHIYGNQETIEFSFIEGKSIMSNTKDNEGGGDSLGYLNPGYASSSENQTYLDMVGKDKPSVPQQQIYSTENDKPHYVNINDHAVDITDYQRTQNEVHTYEMVHIISAYSEIENTDENDGPEVDKTSTGVDSPDGKVQPKEFDKRQLYDESLCILKRLSLGKKNLTFSEFVFFSMESIIKEVERSLFLDIYFIVSGIVVLVLGRNNPNYCLKTLLLPLLVTCYGIFAIDSSVLFFCLRIRCGRLCEYNSCCLIIARILRVFTIIFHTSGSAEIFKRFIEFENEEKAYCSPDFNLVSIYLITSLILSGIAGIIMISIAWFFK